MVDKLNELSLVDDLLNLKFNHSIRDDNQEVNAQNHGNGALFSACKGLCFLMGKE